MRFVLLVALSVTTLLTAGTASAQTALWSDVSTASLGASDLPTLPTAFRTVALDQGAMASRLAGAPDRDLTRGTTLSIPLPEGGLVDVRVAEASIMAPALQARYPEIRTYLADGPGAVHGRLSQTPLGFRAMLFTPNGTVYVDPYLQGDTRHYVVYYSRDLVVDPALRGRTTDEVLGEHAAPSRRDGEQGRAHGETLRTYRLAVAATGEYTAFHGGTVAGGLAAVVTSFNRVTGIYERDLSVSFQLVANNDQLIYTNASTDPYSNTSSDLTANQTNINLVIGSANYDVGHLVGTGGGGVASLGVICTTSKARGLTGSGVPVGDAFDVDYVAHELGHQFGGNHTFNGDSGSCSGGNRNGSTAYEPGSGSTIQAYAGICGNDNLQSNSDAYFHGISLDEMTAHVTTGSGGTCGTTITTGNPIPVVSVPSGFTIPAETPFSLTGSATDDTPGSLTYTWEEFDLGPQADVNAGTVPLFRSFLPTASGTRVFPQLDRLLDGLPPVIGETLPTAAGTYTFRLTARDNNPGAGAIHDASLDVDVVATGSPFAVTFATTPGEIYASGSTTVTWNVAGTNAGAINTPTVDILLATDGETFDTVLAAATPNDGSQTVSFPAVETSDARIMVRAVGNIFFNVNPQPFTISDAEPPAIAVAPGSISRTLPVDGTGSETVTVSNTAPSGALDLTWSVDVVTDAARLQPQAPDTRDLPKGSAEADGSGATALLGAGGPDAFGYEWIDSDEAGGPAVDFQDISGTGTAVTFTPTGSFPAGDEGYADVALPFTFPFYGTDRTSVRVMSNGFLTFSAFASNSFTNGTFPNTATPNAVIAPFWDDLDQSTGGTVYTGTLGDGRFVVQYDGVPRYNTTSSLTFQAILSPDGSVEVQYGTMTGTLTSATVGIENDGGTDGLQVVNNAAYVASNKALLYTSPAAPFITAAPTSGTVAAGADGTFTVNLDATDLAEGVYTADLVVSSNDPTTPTVTVPVTLTVGETGDVSILIDDPKGFRFLGTPAAGLTVDDLAAMNLVRGVPGYYPAADPANLETTYDAATATWIPSTGTGEVLELGKAFRWRFYDNANGNPAISVSVPLPMTISTDLPPNTADVTVELQTAGSRMNMLANPFATDLDLTGIYGWPGGSNIPPTGPQVWVYDPVAKTFVDAPASIPAWMGFRVRAKGTGSAPRLLTIPASAALTGGARLAARETEATPSLTFTLDGTDGGGSRIADRSFAIAFSDDARAAFDADEDVEKFQVPAESYALIGARAGEAFLGVDTRPFAAAEIPLAIEARGTGSRFTLHWDADALPAGLPVVLVDLVTGREIDVRMASS